IPRFVDRDRRRMPTLIAISPYRDSGRNKFNPAEMADHPTSLAIRPRVAASHERGPTIQQTHTAWNIRRIATSVVSRVRALDTAIQCFLPLFQSRRELPGASTLDADLRQQQPLQVHALRR